MRTIEFNLPKYYAPALINGDYDGLNDDEMRILTDFVHNGIFKYGRFDCVGADVDNSYFSPFNDLTGMRNIGADVCKYTFITE